jgi:hypothetical protein
MCHGDAAAAQRPDARLLSCPNTLTRCGMTSAACASSFLQCPSNAPGPTLPGDPLAQGVLMVGRATRPAAILRFLPTPHELVLVAADERVKAVLAQVSERVFANVFLFFVNDLQVAFSVTVYMDGPVVLLLEAHGRRCNGPEFEADVTAVIGPPPGTSPHRSLVAAPKPRGRILSPPLLDLSLSAKQSHQI